MQERQVQSLGWEDPLEKEIATQLQYSCLEKPMDRGAWPATVHRVAKSQTRMSDSTHTRTDYNSYRSVGLILMESLWKILNTGVK